MQWEQNYHEHINNENREVHFNVCKTGQRKANHQSYCVYYTVSPDYR